MEANEDDNNLWRYVSQLYIMYSDASNSRKSTLYYLTCTLTSSCPVLPINKQLT